jgi:predicted flavoprotein YhiN
LDLVKEKSLNELYAYFNKHKNKGRSVEEILLGMFPKMLVMEILKRGEDVVKTCKNLIFNAVGLNSYNQAQITVGGVNINEINECCKSLINENVYIVGEMLDIDGKCGGYNLSFAFLSAIAAGKDIINKLN